MMARAAMLSAGVSLLAVATPAYAQQSGATPTTNPSTALPVPSTPSDVAPGQAQADPLAPVSADVPGTPADAAGDIVVTGTLLGRVTRGAQPITAYTREDLLQQGSPTIINLVKTITSNGGSIGESSRFAGGNTAGAASVNLRGLGNARTLVLLDGHRLAGGDFVDINFMPVAAIGRVEVLRDGAASTYGSDAIAGVVNFITRKDLQGVELNGDYTFIRGSAGDFNLNGAWGWRGDRGNVLLSAGYRRRNELRTTDRSWAFRPYAENPSGGWSAASNPGVFQTGTAAQLASGTFSQSFLDNGCLELGGVLSNPANPAAGCRYHFTEAVDLITPENHYNLFGEVNWEFSDRLKFHFEGLWGSHEANEQLDNTYSTTQFPTPIRASGGSPGGGTSPYPAVGLNQQSRYYIPPTNPGLIAFLANPQNCPALGTICTNAAANGVITSQTLWRPEGQGGNPTDTDGRQRYYNFDQIRASKLRLSGGFSGLIGSGVNWDATVTYDHTVNTADTPDFSVTRLQLAYLGLGGPNCNPVTGTPGTGACMYYNPFSNGFQGDRVLGLANPYYSEAASNNKPELRNWIQDVLHQRNRYDLLVGDLVFNGKLPVTLPGGAIDWALGGQFRRDSYSLTLASRNDLTQTPCVDSVPYGDGTPGCTNGLGAFTFLGAARPVGVSRSVYSVFGELRLPIIDALEATAAVRHERYPSGFGSTTNPKVSVLLKALSWLSLRSSWSTTFRAPPQQLIEPAYAPSNVSLTLPVVGPIYRANILYTNANLRPERAKNFNVGALVSAGGFHASIDYFNINFRDEITTEPVGTLASVMFPSADPATWQCGNAQLRSRFVFNDDGNPATQDCSPTNLLSIATNYINGPRTRTSGLDFEVSQRIPNLVGNLAATIGGDGTWLINYDRSAVFSRDGFLIANASSLVGKSDSGYNKPRVRANAFVNLHVGEHNLRWTTHYRSGVTSIIAGLPDLKVSDEVVHDLVYEWNTPLNTTLIVGVFNVLDSDPPFVRNQINYDYTSGYFLGRNVQVSLRAKF